MSQPTPQPGPVYGQEAAYTAHPAAAQAQGPVAPEARDAGPGPVDAGPPPAYGTGPAPAYPASQVPPPGARYLPRNDLAVWSLVLGVLGVLGCVFFTGVPAVVVGTHARRAVAAGQADNDGMATAGIVLGWIAIGLGVLVVVLVALTVLLPLAFLGLAVPLVDSAGR